MDHGHGALGALLNQLGEEAEHGGGADACGEEVQGRLGVAKAFQSQVTVGVGDLDDCTDFQLVQDGGHLAVGVELHSDAALVLFAGQQGVLACLAQAVTCGNDDGDVLAALGLGHGGLVGGLEGQNYDVLTGLLAVNELEGCEHDVVCLGSVQALLQLDEGVAHEPVDLGPCLNDFGGSQVAQVSGDCLEEVLVDGGVLFFLQAQGCVLVCNAGEDLVRVGVRVLDNVGSEYCDGASQCARLSAFKLGGAGEHTVHQVGAGGEHSTVEVGGDVVNALSNDGQRCLNNGAGLLGEHRCVPSSCVVTSVIVARPLNISIAGHSLRQLSW